MCITSCRYCCRNEFDENRVPALTEDIYIRDIHSISSLLKMYFRELPNPLLTYQLYEKFVVRSCYGLSFSLRVLFHASFLQCLAGSNGSQ